MLHLTLEICEPLLTARGPSPVRFYHGGFLSFTYHQCVTFPRWHLGKKL